MIDMGEWLMKDSMMANIALWSVTLVIAAPVIMVLAFLLWYAAIG